MSNQVQKNMTDTESMDMDKANMDKPEETAKTSQEMLAEQSHLKMCLEIIRENIHRYHREYQERHAQVTELHKALNSGDFEVYNQLMTSSSLEEQAYVGYRKNQAAERRPYFGRVDYLDKTRDCDEQVYIGKNGVFRDKTEVLIADWRAPISSVYYENELGEGEYGLPDEMPIPIDLKSKRTYDISDGELHGFYDSDVAANDELLVKYLSHNKDMVLGEIISTIQKEQNAIIRETPFANLIVQGVAGSGKTTVAMHRISYLLYNYKERFLSNEYCIVGANDLLLNYITSGLPELDVPDIRQLRMDQLLIRLCEKEWQKRQKAADIDESASMRCQLAFFRRLDRYLWDKRLEIIPCKNLTDKQLGQILSKTSILNLLKENPEFSIDKLLGILDDRAKNRIEFLMNGWEESAVNARLKIYNGHYKNKRPGESSKSIYEDFLKRYAQENNLNALADSEDAKSFQKHIRRCVGGEYDIYDIAALALIHYRVHQTAPSSEFGLLFMDEAQDFGIGIYYVLKKLLPNTYFTIMGDVSQNINYHTGLNDWEDLKRIFLTGERDKFLQLNKSYRNTIEISQYAGKILEKASAGQYKIEPVIRHGVPVSEEEYWSDVEMAERTGELLQRFREKGYGTAAIICLTEDIAFQTAEFLKSILPEEPIQILPSENGKPTHGKQVLQTGTMLLPIHLIKGLEFDAVILWNPDIKHGLEKPDSAKLLYVAATRALHELYVLQS